MVIGIIGGMGSYATVDFFSRLMAAFPAEKEWDRPRVIIDNYCTMPSRVRAILYNERRQELVKNLVSSVKGLIAMGATRLVLACNTSHVFLDEIVKQVPESAGMFLNIIDVCGKDLFIKGHRNVGVIASEGTIKTKIYSETFTPYGIYVRTPDESQFNKLRYFIEAVKQNQIEEKLLFEFIKYIDGFPDDVVILGCTELPILYHRSLDVGFRTSKTVFDPLQSTIEFLVKEYSSRC